MTMRFRSGGASLWNLWTVATTSTISGSRAFSVKRTSSTTIMNMAAAASVMTAENRQAIVGLEPAPLWTQFAALSSIPRPSKREHAVLSYIKQFCDEYNNQNNKKKLTWKQDAVGNLVVFCPGQGAGINAPPVLIQGHVDMVTEKNAETVFDFNTDPIRLRTYTKPSGELWMSATDTTLGADNGIGVAASLALLLEDEEAVDMPPLQVLFTVDEETGLTGAMELDVQALGITAKTMLNLDTEEWGELYVGCAGGGESILQLDLQRSSTDTTTTKTAKFVQLKVEGLLGGHSGINIHEGRANAILLCAAATRAVLALCPEARLISIQGGDKHNAIPREARAILQFPVDDDGNKKAAAQKIVDSCAQTARAEYGLLETNLKVTLVDHDVTEDSIMSPLERDSENRLICLLMGLPHGPLKFSHAMPDLVETSNNVASISTSRDTANILCSTRSSVNVEPAREKLSAVAYLAGARMERFPAYPGWNPNLQSPLLHRAQRLLRQQIQGHEPGVKAIHAGLECGLLIDKLGGSVDALSFGPTIHGAHSPDECVCVDTVLPFYNFVLSLLKELATTTTTEETATTT